MDPRRSPLRSAGRCRSTALSHIGRKAGQKRSFATYQSFHWVPRASQASPELKACCWCPLLWLEHPVSLVTPQVPGAASQKTSSNRRARLTSQQDWPGRAQTGLVQTVVSVRAVCSAKRTAQTLADWPVPFLYNNLRDSYVLSH